MLVPLPRAATDIHATTGTVSHCLCREQLIGLTDVTRLHFEKLVNEFEKGLDAALKEYDGEKNFNEDEKGLVSVKGRM